MRLPRSLRHVAATAIAPALPLDRADVLRRSADHGELFWGGAVPFYDSHKRELLGGIEDGAGRNAVAQLYARVDREVPRASQLDRMIGIELRQRLPELLLMRVDKVTMGSSLEARVPYLDHKLVEFALAVPADVKYRNGVTKWVLKRVAERAGLPPSLVYRPKRGFCGQATNMISPRLLARAEQDVFDSPFAQSRFHLGFVRRFLAEMWAGRAGHTFQVWYWG